MCVLYNLWQLVPDTRNNVRIRTMKESTIIMMMMMMMMIIIIIIIIIIISHKNGSSPLA